MTPLLNDRGQLALALRKTFHKFATSGVDDNLEIRARNKRFFLEQQERETAKRTYEEANSHRSRARRHREMNENRSHLESSGGMAFPTRSSSPVMVMGKATGSLTPAPRLPPSAIKPRVPFIIDQMAADKEGFYAPAVNIYTDEMRLDLESVKRKPHFDEEGDLVIPPASVDRTLSLGVLGGGVKSKNKTNMEMAHSALQNERQSSQPVSPIESVIIAPPSPHRKVPKTAEEITPKMTDAFVIGALILLFLCCCVALLFLFCADHNIIYLT